MQFQQSESPLISVITAVLNRVEHLPDCLDSVAMQRGVTIEHIVIDGGSTDGTVELLQQWSDRLAFWSSEPDSGIGDARGFSLRDQIGFAAKLLEDGELLPLQRWGKIHHTRADAKLFLRLHQQRREFAASPTRFQVEKSNRRLEQIDVP